MGRLNSYTSIQFVICGVLFFFFLASQSFSQDSNSKKLEKVYWSTLDEWVSDGGKVIDVQDTVVKTCGKLVMVTVDAKEKISLSTTDREEFHFRVDVCTKMTVNRVHPQPEFENPDIVNSICKESEVELFKKLCKHTGLS